MSTIPSMRQRVQSIDVLRGIVMVVMALDHTRDYFHKVVNNAGGALALDPTNMETTTPILFFTRWITHFCAPIFVFLAGTSAYLMSRKKTIPELRAFMIKRGIWLVIVEVVIITFAWTFNPFYNIIILQVIWAIGISMILLGLVISLPVNTIIAIGAIIILGHNLLDIPSIADSLKGHFISDLVFDAEFAYYNLTPTHGIMVAYAFLPWTGLMLLGYGFGQLYQPGYDPVKRQRLLIKLGAAICLFFIVLRLINIYGDPHPWSVQPRGNIYTFLSFLNLNKYPPSLLYCCMTIGPCMIALSLLEKYGNKFTHFFNQFGRVPMFYYIAHIYLLHLIGMIIFFIQGYGSKDIMTPGNPFLFHPPDFGFSLFYVYVIWIGIILMLYPLCKRYNAYKSTHHQWWLSYF